MTNAPQLPADQQAAMNASERMFRDQMLRAGAKYQTPEGMVITAKRAPGQEPSFLHDEMPATGKTERLTYVDLPTEVDAQDDRYVIDLEVDDVDQREIVLRGREGNERTITLLAPKVETTFMVGRYGVLIAQAYEKLAKTANDKEAERQNNTIKQLHLKMVQLMVSTSDAAYVATLNMRVIREVVAIGQEMIQLSMAMSSQTPLSYIRRIYRMIEQPYGDSDRGVMMWLKEHFAEFEEAYAGNDLPNG